MKGETKMIVIIDNYDSFTYNLVQYYKKLTPNVIVFRPEEVSIHELHQMDIIAIILSPGPGEPQSDGIVTDILSTFHKTTPIFGVCLGMEMIISFFKGGIIENKEPIHGKQSWIEHNGSSVFKGLESPTKVTRYHSLIADNKRFPNHELEITARTKNDEIMAVKHHKYPVEGVQFHPESICTTFGYEMIKNQYTKALDYKRKRGKKFDTTISSI